MSAKKRRNHESCRTSETPSHAESTSIHHTLEPKRLTKRRKLRVSASRLEQLPNELLEQIFLHACNINLATACPSIGARLSTRLTYIRFCEKTFCYLRTRVSKKLEIWPNTNIPFSRVGHTFGVQHSAPPLNSPELTFARNTALQCRWMTYSFWKDMQETITQAEQKRLKNCFSSAEAYTKYCGNGFSIELGSHGLIPSKLLAWPVSQENRDFITELCELGAQIDWVHTMDGEKVMETLDCAIRADDLDLIQLFTRREIGLAVDTKLIIEMMEFCSEKTLWSFISSHTRKNNINWTDEKLWSIAQARQSNEETLWPVRLLEDMIDVLLGSPGWGEHDSDSDDS